MNGAEWVTAQGTIQDTRIVPYNALETKWGSQLTWIAEYRVVYSSGGREYAVWADSGIRGEKQARCAAAVAATSAYVSRAVQP